MKIGVVGAGSIGTYVGGRLSAAGEDVVLLGRESVQSEIRDHGLTLTDHRGQRIHLPAERARYESDPARLADRDVLLVTVKGTDTAGAAEVLAAHTRPGTLVVSLQNGVRNPEILRSRLADRTVLAGMVPFNVVRLPQAVFHNGTSGAIVLEEAHGAERPLLRALVAAGVAAEAHRNMPGVLWGKLIFNLNNAVNALSGVTLREQVTSRAYRLVLAASIREGLAVLSAGGVRAERSGMMIPWIAPTILSLPDWLFSRVAGVMMDIDPAARSSMWEDLERRRRTEIDQLNGEIVRLGREVGVPTPLNERIVGLVRRAESAHAGSPRLSAGEIRGEVRP